MEERITLFLDLELGEKADLETVARASLEFISAIRELAFILDPILQIRVEIESGTEGSLSINSILRSPGKKADSKTLLAIVLTLTGWFANDIRAYVVADVIDQIRGNQKAIHLTDDDIRRIAEEISRASENKSAQQHTRNIYGELKKDSSVKGVGVGTEHGKRPDRIVPKEEFDQKILEIIPVEPLPIPRVRKNREALTLIRPVLLQEERVWRFRSGEGEFGAPIRDAEFLENLLTGNTPVPMVSGLQLDVLLETKEEFINGVWMVRARAVLKVYGTSPPGKQIQLRLTPPQK